MRQDIKASQESYANRPYAARLITSHFSGTFRFDTLSEAIEYLSKQYQEGKKTVSRERCRSFDAYRSCLILPGNIEVKVCEFIGDSLSSY
jgi:hypothetical protein